MRCHQETYTQSRDSNLLFLHLPGMYANYSQCHETEYLDQHKPRLHVQPDPKDPEPLQLLLPSRLFSSAVPSQRHLLQLVKNYLSLLPSCWNFDLLL